MTTLYDIGSNKSIRENPYLDYFTHLLYVAALTGETMLQHLLPLHIVYVKESCHINHRVI